MAHIISSTNLKKIAQENNSYEETEEERIDRLMSENFDPHYPNFEAFKEDLCKKIEIALKEVDEGLGRPIEELFKEWGEKYGIYD